MISLYKNYLIETNAERIILVTKEDQVIIFNEYELDRIGMIPISKYMKEIGNFDEVKHENPEIEVYNLKNFKFDNNFKIVDDIELSTTST